MVTRKLLIAATIVSYTGCGTDPSPATSDSSSSTTTVSSSTQVSSSSSSAQASGLVLQEGDLGVCSFSGEIESEHNGFVGQGYINTENQSGAGVYYQVDSQSQGRMTVRIRYANGADPRSAQIEINQGAGGQVPVEFSNPGWDNWQIAQVAVDLIQGQNTLNLSALSSEGLPNIDSIELVGNGVTASRCTLVTQSSSVASSAPSSEITGASCVSSGNVSVGATIVVAAGTTYDGNCRTHNPTSAVGDGSQAEGQKPVFRVENGGTLKNVIIGNNGADGVHTYGNATIENITWRNVGEDALTIKSSGTVNVRNISGFDGEDKFFQVNASSTLNVENCIINGAGKALRQNGGTTFRIDVTFDRCDISNMGEGVFRTDSTVSTAEIRNSRLRNAGSVCIGNWSSCREQNVTFY